ncbi:MAG: hypothetical protein UZ19_OD1000866 [Parcubacteria bacterium OLB19]|nr:MAG: hypothetical protein UZ19_OD1000866 [Parcubacteria bacterium OLB19]
MQKKIAITTIRNSLGTTLFSIEEMPLWNTNVLTDSVGGKIDFITPLSRKAMLNPFVESSPASANNMSARKIIRIIKTTIFIILIKLSLRYFIKTSLFQS